MGNSDLCWNGAACWHLAAGKCFYRHSWQEEGEATSKRLQQRREEEERRRVEEDKIATEALRYVPELPEELKFYILHFFTPKNLVKLELPSGMLRAVLQVREVAGSGELARRSWKHRLGHSGYMGGEAAALAAMAGRTGLVPGCPVVRPTVYPHTCRTFCSWFAPTGGWDKHYAAYTLPSYHQEQQVEDEEEDAMEEMEEEEELEDITLEDEDDYNSDGSANDINIFEDYNMYDPVYPYHHPYYMG